MLSWIKKRCRQKSTSAIGSTKQRAQPTYFDLQNEAYDHDYEEIDDVMTSSEMVDAVVKTTEHAVMETRHDGKGGTESHSICSVCRKNKIMESVCPCCKQVGNSSDSDDYEIPENFIGLPCSTPEDNLPHVKRLRRMASVDFSKRPLPEIPDVLQPRCRQPISRFTNVAEFSTSDESSDSSGYFDSSCMSRTDSSSDDSFINEFEKMAIHRQAMVCRQSRIISNTPASPERRIPRMGCRALAIPGKMRRSRSAGPPKHHRLNGNTDTRSFKVQRSSHSDLNRTRNPRLLSRAMSSSRLPLIESQSSRLSLRQTEVTEGFYEDVY